ncbi:hypothetical protein EVAR_74226_1 [Eumeta japonica]|uniref:Uncharacterized protein n=1 Tax=Eumeta variegata TaxID=151549 RepID=A0A4C1SCC4_EUMVA|nr:hypothetical protein EVAR_74226_1 [Eumeta japonica]
MVAGGRSRRCRRRATGPRRVAPVCRWLPISCAAEQSRTVFRFSENRRNDTVQEKMSENNDKTRSFRELDVARSVCARAAEWGRCVFGAVYVRCRRVLD